MGKKDTNRNATTPQNKFAETCSISPVSVTYPSSQEAQGVDDSPLLLERIFRPSLFRPWPGLQRAVWGDAGAPGKLSARRS